MDRQEPASRDGAHNYIAHVIDCLEEAETALHLARRQGQMPPSEEAGLERRLEEISREVAKFERSE